MHLLFLSALFCLASFVTAAPNHSCPKPSKDELLISAHTGTYQGFISGIAPDVRQFLRIPFAQSTAGDNRWAPPVKFNTTAANHIDARQWGPACAQYFSRVETIFNTILNQSLILHGDQNPLSGSFVETTSEDCLSLAVFTPKGASGKGLPVIINIPGGGFVAGGINAPGTSPEKWVQRTKDHIVVMINWRVSIMGFPNAAGLDVQNPAILDQRVALEWVRDNIAAFGGDPAKITLWGESAGSISTDVHNFAFYKDPIARSFFSQSGTVYSLLRSFDFSGSNFTFVARQFNCANLPPKEELACMRRVPVRDLINYIGQYQDNSTLATFTVDTPPIQPPINFWPLVDDGLIYKNYTARFLAGHYSKDLPMIHTNTFHEGAGLVPIPYNIITGPPAELMDQIGLYGMWCPAALNAKLRKQTGAAPTYRYIYEGNFTNISPLPWMGANHGSDVPITVLQHDNPLVVDQRATLFQNQTAEALADLVYEFIKDPFAPKGWPSYDRDGRVVILGRAGAPAKFDVDYQSTDRVCEEMGVFDALLAGR